MNIHILSPRIYPCDPAGMEIYNYHFAHELAREGLDVTIHSQCKTLKGSGTCKHILLSDTNFLLVPTLSIWASIFRNLLKSRKTMDILYVPYTSNSSLIYPVLAVNMLAHIPYIVVIHGGGLRPWKDPVFPKKFFMKAGRIVAVSDPIREEYEKRTGREITVIPPLIPFTMSPRSKEELRAAYGFETRDRIIVSVGSIKTIKGSDTLLEAFIRMGKDYTIRNRVHLLYAGDGDLRESLEARVKEHGLEGQVTFLGTIPHEQVPEILKIADIYVIPSQFEGTSLSLLEAMFNGLPIIGSDARGINSMIVAGKNGVLFETGNAADLHEKVKNMLEHIDYYQHLGIQAAADYQIRWHPKHAIDEHLAIISQLAGE